MPQDPRSATLGAYLGVAVFGGLWWAEVGGHDRGRDHRGKLLAATHPTKGFDGNRDGGTVDSGSPALGASRLFCRDDTGAMSVRERPTPPRAGNEGCCSIRMCGRASLNIERWSASAKPHALGWRRHSAPYWNPGATRRHIAGRALWATPAECRKPQVCGLHPPASVTIWQPIAECSAPARGVSWDRVHTTVHRPKRPELGGPPVPARTFPDDA